MNKMEQILTNDSIISLYAKHFPYNINYTTVSRANSYLFICQR